MYAGAERAPRMAGSGNIQIWRPQPPGVGPSADLTAAEMNHLEFSSLSCLNPGV